MLFSRVPGRAPPGDPEEHRSGEHHSFPSYGVHATVNIVHGQLRPTEPETIIRSHISAEQSPARTAPAAVPAAVAKTTQDAEFALLFALAI
jgi:hypothetical protein